MLLIIFIDINKPLSHVISIKNQFLTENPIKTAINTLKAMKINQKLCKTKHSHTSLCFNYEILTSNTLVLFLLFKF